MNKEKLVSILIATYNSEKFIEKTLRSCLNQTYANIEILVLDNNSSDRTIGIIKSIKDDRITLFQNQENVGPYNGLNFLLKKACGRYIAIQDHDDIWFQEKIAKQVAFLETNRDFIGCGTNIFYYFEKRKILILKTFAKVENYVNHTSLMFRNKGFSYNTNVNLPEFYFEKNILSSQGKIGCIQESLTIHRIRDDNNNLSKKSKLKGKENISYLKDSNFSLKSWFFIIYLAIRRFIPESLVWLIRRNITLRKCEWFSESEFRNKFPQIDF